MKGSASAKIFQSPHTDRNGLAKIYLMVTINRKTKWYSLDIKCHPSEFDADKRIVTVNENRRAMNSIISRSLARANKIIIDIIDSQESLDFDTFERLYYNKPKVSSLDRIFQLHTARLTVSRTYKYRKVIEELQELFGGDITLDALNLEMVNRYDKYLYDKGNDTNTVAWKHKCIIAMINTAKRIGEYSGSNPYGVFRVKQKPVTPTFLSTDEIHAIEEYQPSTERLRRIRRLFLFQINTGLRYSDLIALQWKDVDSEGIHLKAQQKTAYPVAIPLTAMAKKILEEMQDETTKPTDSVFDNISNQKYNDYLKLLAEAVGIEKKVTSHVARHTFATHSLELGMPIEIVSKLLGHTDIATTQIYATITNPLLSKYMEKWDKD